MRWTPVEHIAVTAAAAVPDSPSLDLTTFCTREHPRLVGMLSLYCGDRLLAEELAQEALARACRDWRKLQHHPTPGAWLSRVAVNLAKSSFRSTAARRRATDRLGHVGPSSHADLDSADVIATRKAVSSLPIRQRTALVLRYYADLSVADVARLMRCREGTVKALTSQAIASLRAAGLADGEGSPDE